MVSECGEVVCLDAKQQSFGLLHIGVHMQRVLTMQRVTGGFLEHGLTKKQAEGKLPLLPALSNASEPVGMLFHWTLSLKWSSARIAARMAVPINVEMEIGCVFLHASYPTSLREQVTSLLEEAVLQVSFPQSLAEAMLVISNYSDFFLLHVSSLFIDHNPNGSFVCIYFP